MLDSPLAYLNVKTVFFIHYFPLLPLEIAGSPSSDLTIARYCLFKKDSKFLDGRAFNVFVSQGCCN